MCGAGPVAASGSGTAPFATGTRQQTTEFDRKAGFEGLASQIFYAIKKQFKDLGWDTGLGDMRFGAKDKDIPLQAANLLVGVVARNRLRLRHKGLPLEEETMEKSLLTLGKSGNLLVSEKS